MQQKKLAAEHKTMAAALEDAGPVQSTVTEATAEVLAPADAGADGFPRLPSVSQMLSGASGTLQTVNSQTSGLTAQVVKAQMQSESKMAKQKAAFEEKLKQQEEKNRLVIEANANITADIKNLQRSNADYRKQAHEIEGNNHLMRSEFHTLESRLGLAQDFTSKSLKSTDDRKNALLQVLRSAPRHHRNVLAQASSKNAHKAGDDDNEDEDDNTDDSQSNSDDKDDDDDDDDDKGTSLLSLSMTVHRNSAPATSPDASIAELEGMDSLPAAPASDPADLLAVLVKDVANLAQQEKASLKKLKQLFIEDFRAGAKRKAALLSQQKGLTATRSSLQALQAKLKTADAHLKETSAHLQGRLHGLGQYLQKLAHFALAPEKEVPHLLEVLPKSVTVKPLSTRK